MKTLGKLKISSEKLLKNEELVHLMGGYTYYAVDCYDGEKQCGRGVVSDCAVADVVCEGCPSGYTYTCESM